VQSLRISRLAAVVGTLANFENFVDVEASRAADLSIRTPDASILATGHHVGAAAVITADKKLIRAAPELVELVVP
jgi:predicted nucleic acid-binding protein